MNEEQLRAIMERHGGLANVYALDPYTDEYITSADGSRVATGRQIPNSRPRYRYVMSDGTTLEARAEGNGQHTVTSGGTAMRQNSQGQTTRTVGGVLYEQDPDTGEWTPAIIPEEKTTPAALAKAAYDEAYYKDRLAKLQAGGSSGSASDGVGWANLTQRQYEFDQKMAWDKLLAEMKARQDQEQADRSLQGSLFGHLSNSFTQNLPRMGDPSQVYFAGAQPGGPLETLFRQGGSSYDPAQGKIQWQQYDPNALWRQTAGMVKR